MTQPKEMSNTMSEQNAYDLAVKELRVDEWVYNTIMTNGVVDIEKAKKALPKAELWAAEGLVHMLQGRLTYVNGEDRWHVWDGRIHLPCEGDAMAMKFIKLYYKLVAEAMELVKETYVSKGKVEEASGVDEAYKKAIKQYNTAFDAQKSFRDRLANTQTQRGVLAQLKVELGVESDHYDNDRDYLVVRNCVINAKKSRETKQLVIEQHDPSRPVWRYFDADYRPGAEANNLRHFLKTSLADETQGRFLQMNLGGAIVGAPDKTKTIIDAFGATNSGKSMFNNVLEQLCGDYYVEVTEPAVAENARDGDRYRDDMCGARIITVLEPKAKLDKSFILKYTGGDTIETSKKYRNNKKWKPQGIIMMMSNEGMNLSSQEEAVQARIERINFPHTFSANPTNPQYKTDAQLQQKIVAEADGFLMWLLEGFMMYLGENTDGKIPASDSMQILKLEMQDNEDSFAIFWEKFCDTVYMMDGSAPDYKKADWSGVYGKYKIWCKNTGRDVMGKTDAKAWATRHGIIAKLGDRLRLVDRVYNDKHELPLFDN